MAFRRVFHGFLRQSRFALWIWLESECRLEYAGAFRTRLSDRRTACSHPVGAPTLLSIAVCILSAASTGIDCYYCIYIDISIYILRRSKRQAIWLEFNRGETDLSSGFVECPEVWALHGADAAHIMQAGAHPVSDAVSECFFARCRAGIFFFARFL